MHPILSFLLLTQKYDTNLNTLLEKLNGLVARFEEVSTLITDPNVIADQQRYVRLTKEYKELEDLMKARKEYANLLGNLEESKDILLNESDPEMKEMAREEVASCEARIPSLEEEIKLMLVPKDPRTLRMPFSKFVVVREATKQHCLLVTYFVCTLNSAKRKVGNGGFECKRRCCRRL